MPIYATFTTSQKPLTAAGLTALTHNNAPQQNICLVKSPQLPAALALLNTILHKWLLMPQMHSDCTLLDLPEAMKAIE